MLIHAKKISLRLIFVSVFIIFENVQARHVTPVTYGYVVRSPSNEFDLDLEISAAEPRPVFVEIVKHPQTASLVPHASALSADSEATVSDASEKVEKILRLPMAFSYNTDQAHEASALIVNSPQEKLQAFESKVRLDQQPDAIDYYKYIARLEEEEKNDGGGGSAAEHSDSSEDQGKQQNKQKEDIRVVSRPNVPITNYNPFHEDKQASPQVLRPVGFHVTSPVQFEHEDKTEEVHEVSHKSQPILISEASHSAPVDTGSSDDDDEESHAALSDSGKSHEDHSDDGHSGASDSSNSQNEDSHEAVKEVEASASHADGGGGHGGGGGGGHSGGGGGGGHGGGGGGGGSANYKKGGGREHHAQHHGEHGEHGDKTYKGQHYHEKAEKGHHDKEGYKKEFEEGGGLKKGHHDEDGYHAEHSHGEEGKRGTEFYEDGEHSKGHSTKGEHNIRKKDEFEKKQEFYDESHEGGEHEKHGEYFHEDDYHKGGHHKSEHKKGGHHEDHYGKEGHFEKGGHHHEDQGHKEADGHDTHHDVHEKHQEKIGNTGGTKWHYEKGTGGGGGGGSGGGGHGGGDSKGAHQNVLEIVKETEVPAADEKHDGDIPHDNEGQNYHVHEINNDGKLHGNDADVTNGGHQVHNVESDNHKHAGYSADTQGEHSVGQHEEKNAEGLESGGKGEQSTEAEYPAHIHGGHEKHNVGVDEGHDHGSPAQHSTEDHEGHGTGVHESRSASIHDGHQEGTGGDHGHLAQVHKYEDEGHGLGDQGKQQSLEGTSQGGGEVQGYGSEAQAHGYVCPFYLHAQNKLQGHGSGHSADTGGEGHAHKFVADHEDVNANTAREETNNEQIVYKETDKE